MAKKPPVGKCVHCLADNMRRNWDHVFPKSWYPESTPKDVEKWKIPSCMGCNNKLSKVEEDFLTVIAPCIDSEHTGARGVVKRVFDSINPDLAKNARDQKARIAKRQRLHKNIRAAQESSVGFAHDVGVYPGLGERWDRRPGEGIPINLPAAWITQICEKIVRGIFYVKHERFIEPPFKIVWYALDNDNSVEIRAFIDSHGVEYARGPGFIVRECMPPENNNYAMYKIDLWGQFRMYAWVSDD